MNSPWNLGVICANNFNFRSHISAICSSCIYHIWDLWRTHRHLDLDNAKSLANAPVSSCLDYCNSLLSGIANIDLAKLKHILNRLARLVTKSTPFTRSVPLLCSLWLPVSYRVHFKICLLTYEALHKEHPVNLHSLLATCLWDQTKESLSRSLGPRPTPAPGHIGLAPILFETASYCLFSQPCQLLPSRDVSKHVFLVDLSPRHRLTWRSVDVTE